MPTKLRQMGRLEPDLFAPCSRLVARQRVWNRLCGSDRYGRPNGLTWLVANPPACQS